MTKLELEMHDDVVSVLHKIRNIDDLGIELFIPEGSVLFENILNLKLLRKEVEGDGKTLHFDTSDEIGGDMIASLEEGSGTAFLPDEVGDFGFNDEESVGSKRGWLSKLKIPKFGFGFRLPRLRFNFVGIAIALILLAIVSVGVFKLVKSPHAKINIVVESQPLTRSLTIKVSSVSETNKESMILRGGVISDVITSTEKIETTGEKLEGEKAKGTIKIFNKTDSEIELDKNSQLAYKEDDNDLVFYTNDDVTIPARTEEDPLDPGSALIPGEATVGVTAGDIGGDYNIEEGSTLEFEEYKKTELIAESDDDFSGGKSETIRVVTEEDKTQLSDKLIESSTSQAQEALKSKARDGKVYIEGSSVMSTQSEEYDHKVGDEADEVSLVRTVNIEGLAYSENDLKDFVADVIEEFVPEGFELFSKDLDVKVEVLGNTDSTVLSSSEADLQVTAKTNVVASVDEDTLKEEVAGKDIQGAERVLGGISNIKTYSLNITPNIPFLRKIPSDISRISIEIEKQ